jgi:ubiquinone/menaquinone biosynthesis C-methylase UbiE
MTEPSHSDRILDQFTRQAPAFSAAAMITDAAVLGRIVERAGAGSADTVLDVACGPGLVVCAFAPRVRRATGLDFTPAMLDHARALAVERGLDNVTWNRGDAYRLPYADGSFSIVVTRYLLHHLRDPLAAMREMVRVCAPHGRLVVVDAYAPADAAQALVRPPVPRPPAAPESLRRPATARRTPLRKYTGAQTDL